MRWDEDAWSDRVDRVLDVGDRLELAVYLAAIVGAVVGGAAALLGLPVTPAIALGVVVAVVVLLVLRRRAKRRGTTLFGDD